jgi:hypothetical protein
MSDSDDNEFDDEMPLSGLRKSTADDDDSPRKRKAVNYAEESEEEGEEEEEEDDDDDDDLPLAALKGPSPKKKKAPAKKKATTSKKKKTASSTSTSSSTVTTNGNYQSPSAALYGSNCQKGQLIQKLLCRWWYAIEWPDPATLPEKSPKYYDRLDGFPGVYVCTKGDEVGKIMDLRDKEKCPCFNNFAKMSSEELQKLLLKALEAQKAQLVKLEGTGTATESELNAMIKWATKLKPASADKEAVKVLKAAKLSLP